MYKNKNVVLEVRAVDENYFSNSEINNIKI